MALPRFILISAISMLLFYGLSVMVSTAAYRGFGLDRQLDTGSRASDLTFGALGASAVVYNRTPPHPERATSDPHWVLQLPALFPPTRSLPKCREYPPAIWQSTAATLWILNAW